MYYDECELFLKWKHGSVNRLTMKGLMSCAKRKESKKTENVFIYIFYVESVLAFLKS